MMERPPFEPLKIPRWLELTGIICSILGFVICLAIAVALILQN